jgi:HTH-type transcriptional regulator, sugar sensing transcriptional regulator
MLQDFGFDKIDAQVYVYLAKKGIQKASDMCKALKLEKQQLYPSLKRLQGKGIVTSTFEHPARFSALPFEKVLNLFINEKMEETKRLQQNKEAILSNWQNLKLEDDMLAKFTVIEGRAFLFSKIQQFLQEATTQVLAVTTVPTLAQMDQHGIFNVTHPSCSKPEVRLRFLAELSEQNMHVAEALLKEMAMAKLNVEGRNPDLGLNSFPHMLVRDYSEVLLFTKPRTEMSVIEKEEVCLWTDCKPLVQAFTAMFEEVWRNSTEMREKLVEIKTGKPTPKTLIIEDSNLAKEKYNKTLKSAKQEILVLTSSEGLVNFSKDMPQLRQWRERGVAVKIMAPILSENFEAANQLSQVCSVRHVPPNNLLTSIVDGEHLFQFKEPSLKIHLPQSSSKAYYTSNHEYVQKMQTMLNEVWRNSTNPASDNLKSIFGEEVGCVAYYPGVIGSPGSHGAFYRLPFDPAMKGKNPIIVNDDLYGKLTEQDVLNEIIVGQSSPIESNTWKFYSSQAIAIFSLPESFNLPRVLFRAHHIEKHSTFSEQDTVIINLWLETSKGHFYVPVAVLGNRPQSQSFWERQFSATPAGHNFQLARNEELQIRVHGNTLFAGWTVPITLYPSKYVLPPACILIEGYGEVKTQAYRFIQPTGAKLRFKQNGFDAFVTFMYPSSKYSGPGTGGFLVRDFVLEATPQFFKGFNPKLVMGQIGTKPDKSVKDSDSDLPPNKIGGPAGI